MYSNVEEKVRSKYHIKDEEVIRAYDRKKIAPESAACLNPYREWIGAQIRGDFYGYVNPGNPLEAAKMAYRDGAVSHIKNGIYGEMYVAALISLTAVSKDMLWNCSEALKQIPPKSRIAEDINIILNKYREKASYESVIQYIHQKYNQKDFFDWCYVNPNAMIVTAGILWFSDQFGEAIIQTVLAGFDTDCNGRF
ncbi:ADP-ribosylglycohydrolase family protein [Clostridium sp. Marseille-P2415]|uniref:ADP-ribosylglycohydrolase family protein n=1 Tax=Clostridium sp. Marseille-P2415 TaxID=1805471 RepID=UPI00098891A8|nr:ADP-ribosylglycohydrolase family protein [Clostridium sp. Marseille-P2415]